MQFGEIVRELRKKHKLTQEKVSQLTGVDRTTVNKWETINAVPNAEILKTLADYFNVTIDYLVGRTDTLDSVVIPRPLNDIQFAFHGGLDGLTQDDIEDVVKFVEFIKSKKK